MTHADIIYKTAEGYAAANNWEAATRLYLLASDYAPNEDYYYLFVGTVQADSFSGITVMFSGLPCLSMLTAPVDGTGHFSLPAYYGPNDVGYAVAQAAQGSETSEEYSIYVS